MGILVLIIFLLLCILLSIGLYRWKWGVVALFSISGILVVVACLTLKDYFDQKKIVDEFVGKPFAEGDIRFSPDNLVAEIPVDRLYLQKARKRFDLKSPVGIRLTLSSGTVGEDTARSWCFNWVNPDGAMTYSSAALVDLNPDKQENWLHQISWAVDDDDAVALRIEETDPQASYSGKITFFFTGRGLERLREQLAIISCIYLLLLSSILGVGGTCGCIKKRWLARPQKVVD